MPLFFQIYFLSPISPSIAFDNLADVWDEDDIVGEARRLSICKPCYRHYKKEKKDDESQTW